VRSRVFRWYGKLREIEARVAQGTAAPGEIQAELDQLERQVQGVNVPLSYADEVYALRNYVRMIRERLAA
jgi:phytoene/squalene synthetase